MDYIQKIDTSSLSFKNKSLTPSKGKSDKEKEIAQVLSDLVHDEAIYKEFKLMKVNFDVEIIKNKAYIRSIYLIKENCEVVQVPYNRLLTRKEKRPIALRKVGAFMFPLGTPTIFSSYAEEMRETTEKPWLKLILTSIFTSIISFLGIKLATLLVGLFVVAIFDLFISLIPGNVKEGHEKDHTIQVKFFAFLTNFIGIVSITKGMDYLLAFSGDVPVVSDYIHPYIPYVVASWCFMLYIYRIVKYMARANRTKLPKSLKKMFNDDVSA